MSEIQNYQQMIPNKSWSDQGPFLFKKQFLALKSKETNSIFGQFDLMELKNNSEVITPTRIFGFPKTPFPFFSFSHFKKYTKTEILFIREIRRIGRVNSQGLDRAHQVQNEAEVRGAGNAAQAGASAELQRHQQHLPGLLLPRQAETVHRQKGVPLQGLLSISE